MQVSGLKGRFASAAYVAVRAEAAERGAEAAFRRDVLNRWHAARREGPATGKVTEVVGVPRSTLFGWEGPGKRNRLEPRSRRPLCACGGPTGRRAWSARSRRPARTSRTPRLERRGACLFVVPIAVPIFTKLNLGRQRNDRAQESHCKINSQSEPATATINSASA